MKMSARRKWFRIILWSCMIGVLLCVVAVISCNIAVKQCAKGRMYDVILIPESHNAEYRVQLASVAKRVEQNDTVSISEIRGVMPETEDFYHIVCEFDCSARTTPQLFLLWEKYAVADSAGFMENYLRMYQWSDGYFAEGMYDVLSAAEKRHKAKFDSLLRLPSMKESAERYRLGLD